MTENEKIFEKQCYEVGSKVNDVLSKYPKHVIICAIPGLMAAISKAFGLPRDTMIAMFDSALEDINEDENG
jgi:hypothetical protein